MTDRKFRKMVCEHPYMLDDIYTISLSEAKKIYKQGFPTAEEIVAGAKKKYDFLPAEGWKPFDDALKKQKEKEQRHRIGTLDLSRFISSVSRHRRLAAACLIFAFALAFFTLIPAGKVLAKNIARFFVEVIENRIEVIPNETMGFVDDGSSEQEEALFEYRSFEQLPNDLTIEPFILNCDWAVVESVTYEVTVGNNRLISLYNIGGDYIYVLQIWNLGNAHDIIVQNKTYLQTTVMGGNTLYYQQDVVDKTYDGFVFFDEYYLQFHSAKAENFFKLISEIK